MVRKKSLRITAVTVRTRDPRLLSSKMQSQLFRMLAMPHEQDSADYKQIPRSDHVEMLSRFSLKGIHQPRLAPHLHHIVRPACPGLEVMRVESRLAFNRRFCADRCAQLERAALRYPILAPARRRLTIPGAH